MDLPALWRLGLVGTDIACVALPRTSRAAPKVWYHKTGAPQSSGPVMMLGAAWHGGASGAAGKG